MVQRTHPAIQMAGWKATHSPGQKPHGARPILFDQLHHLVQLIICTTPDSINSRKSFHLRLNTSSVLWNIFINDQEQISASINPAIQSLQAAAFNSPVNKSLQKFLAILNTSFSSTISIL